MKNYIQSFITHHLFGNKVITLVFIIITSVFLHSIAEAQTNKKIKTKIKLSYFKNSDDSKTLRSSLKYKKDKKYKPVNDVLILFYTTTDTTDILIGKAETNDKGEAVLNFERDYTISMDSAGNFTLKARFEGNDSCKASATDITIKDIRIELTLDVIDSLKTISVFVYQNNAGSTPVEEEDVYFYVVRLFSLLNIGEGWLEGGEASFEFPDDLPGDSLGNVTIVAKIKDSDLYGNVEKRKSIDWGKVTSGIDSKYIPIIFGAPWWVIIIIYILLLGSVLFSVFAMFKLFLLIRKNNTRIIK